jgi:hypothetical protein
LTIGVNGEINFQIISMREIFKMGIAIQIIRAHYQGKILSFFNSGDITPLYRVQTPNKTLEISLSRSESTPSNASSPPVYDLKPEKAPQLFAIATTLPLARS